MPPGCASRSTYRFWSLAAEGGTVVTVLGTGFTARTTVLFGTVASPAVNILSGEVLTAVAPPQAPNTVVTLAVGRPDGQSLTTATTYTYDGPPVLALLGLQDLFKEKTNFLKRMY